MSVDRFRRGMSLVEMLVVITIVAVLIALLIPALGVVRVRADAAKIRTDLRTLVQAGTMFTNDHDGQLPAPADPEYVGGQDFADPPLPYFHFEEVWRQEWGVEYLGLNTIDDDPMLHDYQDGQRIPYLYSGACFSAPVFWDGKTERTEAMLVPQRSASVTYPAQKAMFVSAMQSGRMQMIAYNYPDGDGTPVFEGRVPFGLVDGHADFFAPGRLAPPDWRGDFGEPWAWLGLPVHGLCTADGVRGMDIK
ncbi:MAG TPA: type II secretion system protein [Phycisphaerales bacterium]|nr:type II secretion system protein [Phycisphaerales bacterium]